MNTLEKKIKIRGKIQTTQYIHGLVFHNINKFECIEDNLINKFIQFLKEEHKIYPTINEGQTYYTSNQQYDIECKFKAFYRPRHLTKI